MPSTIRVGTAAIVLLVVAGVGQADFIAHFDQPAYNVLPGAAVSVQVLLDADTLAVGDQPTPGGLLSMGITVGFDSTKAVVGDISKVVLPLELRSDGLGGPPVLEVAPGQAKALGAVNVFTATEGYGGTLLATIEITNLALLGDSYALSLSRYSASPTFANFVDWNGIVLDNQVSFGSTIVNVVPEPASLALLGLGGLGLLLKRRRAATA